MDVKYLVSQMTLEEKASLLSGGDFWHTKAVQRLGIRPVMVSDGPHGLRKQRQEADHLGVNESIKAVCFPTACATAASFDPALTREMGEALGDACQHESVAVLLGPGVNIKRSPLCGRNFEYFSEDPFLAGEMAASLIEGVQSRGIGTSLKHYLANNQEHRRMSSSSDMDSRTLREIYMPAFEKAVKRGKPWIVMCSYNRVNGEYVNESRFLLTDVLRGEWGFDGYVMSDWGAVSDRVRGVHAGMDLEMPASGGVNDRRVVEAVRSGALDEREVDLAVERILTVNERYFQNARPQTPWDMEKQHAQARRMAAECMVLLKNEDDALPLTPGASVAVIGAFAATPRFQGGGSSHINSFKVESLLDALQGVPNVTYAQGYTLEGDGHDEALLEEAVRAARAAQTAVIVAGLPDAYESEGYDRTHLRMPEGQNELIRRVSQANPNTVVVLYNGSPVEMPWLGGVKAVVEAYLGGQAVGGATRDILWGDVNPCGRLPETFPLRLEDTPCFLTYGGEGDHAPYSEGLFVGYRYYDKKRMEVLFPFGYGLSYTRFAYANLRLSAASIRDTDALEVSVEVTNTGNRKGKEVVQLYVADRESSALRPLRELKGMAKVELAPGETREVRFTLDHRAFAYWSEELGDWYVESGAFGIQIGRSSRDIALEAEVEVTGTKTLPAHFTMNSIFIDLMKNEKARMELKPLIDAVAQTLGGPREDGEAAQSAITNDMMQAMINYMPLRGLVSFGGGLSHEALEDILRRINDPDAPGACAR